MAKQYYRVMVPEPLYEDHERQIPLPGGSSRLEGFWTPHLECALKIRATREEASIMMCGGGTWAVITVAPDSALRLVPIPEGAKQGHNEAFDRDEVFAEAVDATKVRYLTHEEIVHLIKERGWRVP